MAASILGPQLFELAKNAINSKSGKKAVRSRLNKAYQAWDQGDTLGSKLGNAIYSAVTGKRSQKLPQKQLESIQSDGQW